MTYLAVCQTHQTYVLIVQMWHSKMFDTKYFVVHNFQLYFTADAHKPAYSCICCSLHIVNHMHQYSRCCCSWCDMCCTSWSKLASCTSSHDIHWYWWIWPSPCWLRWLHSFARQLTATDSVIFTSFLYIIKYHRLFVIVLQVQACIWNKDWCIASADHCNVLLCFITHANSCWL